MMHVHCLHWLMSTGLFLLSAFCQTCKSSTGEKAPIQMLCPVTKQCIWSLYKLVSAAVHNTIQTKL